MPSPPDNRSICRTGQGFQISNKRNKTNPSSQLFQFNAVAPDRVQPLADNFVHHHNLRVALVTFPSHHIGRPHRGAKQEKSEHGIPDRRDYKMSVKQPSYEQPSQ